MRLALRVVMAATAFLPLASALAVLISNVVDPSYRAVYQDRLWFVVVYLAGWVAEGKVKWKETVFEGLDQAPEAFLGLFSGENLGKMLVKLS